MCLSAAVKGGVFIIKLSSDKRVLVCVYVCVVYGTYWQVVCVWVCVCVCVCVCVLVRRAGGQKRALVLLL